MSEKPWRLNVDIPTPSLGTPNSSTLDVNSVITENDELSLGKTITITTSQHNLKQFYGNIEDDKGDEEPPVTSKELRGWYMYNAATEVYSVVAITVFIPIILENLAGEAGFLLDRVTPCDTTIKDYKCVTRYGTGFVDTASFSLYTISISVLIQCLVYIGFGSLADHGENQKKLLMLFSYIGAISVIAFLSVVNSSLYWLAGLLTIISNVCFGAGFVFYLAYIPVFTRVHPRVIEAKSSGVSIQDLSRIEEEVANRLSSHSMAIGYASGVLILIIAAAISYLMNGTTYSLQVGTALAGAWWLMLLTFPLIWLQRRKSPPLPNGENFLFYSFKRVGKTLQSTRQLFQTIKFLISWFILSDGFNTIASVAILFGKKSLNIGNTELLIAAVLIPISAFVGVYTFLFIQQKFELSTRTMILILGTLHSLIPIYGLLGFVSPIGLKFTVEIYIFAIYFGLVLGALQSYCRVLFGSMIPKGHENEFFGLYEITDKGSSWIGPLVTGFIGDLTHDLRYCFWFLLVMMIIPLLLIYTVNVEQALLGDDKTTINEAEESRLAEKARLIEHYIYRDSNFTVNKHYKDTARSKIWNLKDKKNPKLRRNVAEGIISEEYFAKMDAEAMASKERKRQNTMIRKNSLASSIAVADYKPVQYYSDPSEPKITLSDRAGNRVWSGTDMDSTI
ncbi:241_t:CDS:2 [Funneliformis mosseae]|uniref:Autophagy-related protein n=1 Tax=Funneliformis mosseae TaxID=27381 RepID=A0A9N9GU32_FUNMO|nr:241_t:CDS:2 [Funneliformis mosseae]